MNKREREEATKWLRLAEETYGEAGVSAMAEALSLASDRDAADSPLGASWTATSGGGSLGAEEPPLPPDDRVRYGNASPAPRQGTPAVPPRGDAEWRTYDGDPWWFHCDYDGYQENREASPDWPIGECFYDENGVLVDEDHPYAKFAGTPNSYPPFDPRHWLWVDPGGIWSNFGTLGESVRQRYDRNRAWLRDTGYEVPPSSPPRAPFPY